jgi:hypothetical protein
VEQLAMTRWGWLSIKPFFGPIAALLVLSLPVGCTTTKKMYEGPELPGDQIAVVSTSGNPGLGKHTHIISVEGISTWKVDNAEVLPGDSTFEIVHGLGGCAGYDYSGIISFEARAGHEYQIETERDFIWVVDKGTGEIVAIL